MKLRAGRYTLMVPNGHGPAGVHRQVGDIQLDHHGGSVAFDVPAEERVYFWWRGPSEPSGLRIVGMPALNDSSQRPAATRPAAIRRGSRSPAANRMRGESSGPADRLSA